MKKIKKIIIHALGGITVEEDQENQKNMKDLASWCTVIRIKNYLELLNGADAETWRKSAYRYICRLEEVITHKPHDFDNGK